MNKLLWNLMKEINIPLTLKEMKDRDGNPYIDEKVYLETIEPLSYKAFEDQCTTANPRLPKVTELQELYRKAYYGK